MVNILKYYQALTAIIVVLGSYDEVEEFILKMECHLNILIFVGVY